jgi:hypothetical protein
MCWSSQIYVIMVLFELFKSVEQLCGIPYRETECRDGGAHQDGLYQLGVLRTRSPEPKIQVLEFSHSDIINSHSMLSRSHRMSEYKVIVRNGMNHPEPGERQVNKAEKLQYVSTCPRETGTFAPLVRSIQLSRIS